MSGHNQLGRDSRYATFLATALSLCSACCVVSVRADEVLAKGDGPRVASTTAGKSADAAKASQERIQSLIRDLGNPKYSARRAAAAQLRQIGAEAFDSLHAATEDNDPEVAASANYLLRQIAVNWGQADDPPTVRAIMKQYSQEAEAARLQSVELLQKVSKGGGLAALCRIARYDRSPLVSRAAAIAIIRPKDAEATRPQVDAAVVEQQLGASTRASAMWLRQYLAQLRDPNSAIASWKPLVDEEAARLAKSSDTTSDIVIRLEWNLAELHRQNNDQAAVMALLDRMMERTSETSDEMIVNLLVWITKNKSWDVLDVFLTKHQTRLEQSKRPLYYAALARAEQGKGELAEEVAARAAQVEAQAPLENFTTAKDLEEHGKFDWAVREYRRLVDKPGDSGETILARIYLSGLLHDYERDKDAADVLEPLAKGVQGGGDVAKLYSRIREYGNGRSGLPEQDTILARYHFYRACEYQAEKDYSRARGELDLAINFDEQDADVLIAMFHFPEADEKWRDSVRKRVKQLTDKFQQQIDDDPSDASPYNQWAWLVSNTDGDFQKAIRYSHRSLELNSNGASGEASYLDTLGRCYYAAGDFENAVKYEREAIAKVKYMQVMQRQLKLFEKALADKKSGTPSPDSSK